MLKEGGEKSVGRKTAENKETTGKSGEIFLRSSQ